MRTKEWLKAQREKNNLTQQDLADKIDVSKFTIENIEQGKRLGSVETWEKIEDFFKADTMKISYDSEDLINELKGDILEFGENKECILVYKVYDDGRIFFTNYDFIVDETPFDPNKELEPDEKYIETTFKYALEVLESQNKMF